MGKAKLRKTAVDIIKQNEIDKKKAFGIARNNFTGIVQAGSSSAQGLANGSVGGTQDTESYLKTSGDTMVGSMAFYPKSLTVASGSISLLTAVGTNVASSTSRVVLLGEGGSADNLLTINGATHAGQILFIQAVLTTPITLVTGTGNIYIPNGSNYVISGKDIVLLQWDTINTTWTMISGNSTGGVGLGDTNNWTGVNTFANSVSFNGSTTTVGDDVNDVFTLYGKMGSNINMNDYDITTVDRLKFSATGTDNLATTDYGIATDSTDSDDLHYNVPSGRSHEFDVAGTQTLHISPTLVTSQVSLWVAGAITATGNVSFRGTTTIGNSASDTVTFTAVAASNLDMATYDLERVGQIEFSSTSHYIKSNSVGFEYRVPVGDDHEFFVNGVSSLKIDNVGIDLNTGDIDSVGTINTTAITVTNSFSSTGFNQLGDAAGDLTWLYGMIDFKANTNATNQTASDSDGYINIKVGGVAKKLYYY